MKTVYLSGEGPTELGDWFKERPYRASGTSQRDRGVLEALLEWRLGPQSVTVVDGIPWKNIRLYRAGDHRGPETRKILQLCTRAAEAHCAVLVFSRDRDRDEDREKDVEAGIRAAKELGHQVEVVGGVAIEEIEAWLWALQGYGGSEELTNPKARLAKLRAHVGADERLAIVDAAQFERIPPDARSLLLWLGRADSAFRE